MPEVCIARGRLHPVRPHPNTPPRCAACGRIEGAARALCAACLSHGRQPGAGRVASVTTIRRAPTRFRDQAPDVVVVVDRDAGPRVTGRLAPGSGPAAIGAAVHARRTEPDQLLFTVLEPP